MEKKTNMKTAASVSAISAALAVGTAVAGYYFYTSKDAKKHRKIAAKWAVGFKKDVLKAAKKMKAIDEKAMKVVVAEASKRYEAMKNVDKKDVQAAARELKNNWQRIVTELGKGAKVVGKVAKKAAPKQMKKAPKKTVAKKKK